MVKANGKKVATDQPVKEKAEPAKKSPAVKAAKPAKPAAKPKASPKPKASAKPATPKAKAAPKEKAAQAVKDDGKMPGQRYPTPEEGDGTLIFYRSLYEHDSSSQFAEKWLMEYGCLSPDQQKAAAAKYKVK